MHWLPIVLGTWNETMRVCAPTVIDAALGRVTKDKCDKRLEEWAATAVRLADIKIHVRGEENLDLARDEQFVVISNHQSSYDIFVLMHAYPGSLRMVAKKQMFSIPVMGGAMKAAGFVSLDRGNHERARTALREAQASFARGTSVWIAPEGTRSDDGRLLPFKKGGFIFALNAGVRILPVTVLGTRHVLPSKDHRVRAGKSVELVFHAPVDPSAYGYDRRDELVSHVRETIVSAQPAELQT